MTYLEFKQGINKKVIQPLVMHKRRAEFRAVTPTIISVNCIGGGIYHDLGWEFLSPTINLFFLPDDYICFVSNMKEYVKQPLHFERIGYSGKEYPICSLGDDGNLKKLELHFLHYANFKECCEKWESRCNRIDWNHIVLIFTDQNGCTIDHIQEFLKLPYSKMLFYGKIDISKLIADDKTIFIPVSPTKTEIKQGENPVDHCMIFDGFTGHRRYEKNVDVCKYMKAVLALS